MKSYSNFSVIRFKVELLTSRCQSSRNWIIEVRNMGLEFFFAFCSSKIEGENSSISSNFSLLFRVPSLILFIHEVSVPCFGSKDTIVEKPFNNDVMRHHCPSSLRSHVRPIVVVSKRIPFSLQLLVIEVCLSGSFSSEVLRNEKSWKSKINFEISWSSFGFKDPMVRMEAINFRLFSTFLSWYARTKHFSWDVYHYGEACLRKSILNFNFY